MGLVLSAHRWGFPEHSLSVPARTPPDGAHGQPRCRDVARLCSCSAAAPVPPAPVTAHRLWGREVSHQPSLSFPQPQHNTSSFHTEPFPPPQEPEEGRGKALLALLAPQQHHSSGRTAEFIVTWVWLTKRLFLTVTCTCSRSSLACQVPLGARSGSEQDHPSPGVRAALPWVSLGE